VTIIEMLTDFATDVEPFSRIFMLERFEQSDIQVLTDTKVEEINNMGVVCSKDGKRQTIEAGAILLAVGVVSNDHLVKELNGKVDEVYVVGDCKQPRRIREAIEEGFQVACEV
jgi:pyruvate/2-oxoglutarate dehydrogenase complex dihydrolipoamide dehydrogenase (E3) component